MMVLKTFQAETMAEALAAVKRHFGREAVILHTRTVDRGGFLGRRGGQMIEVTAARGDRAAPPGSSNHRAAPAGSSNHRAAAPGSSNHRAAPPGSSNHRAAPAGSSNHRAAPARPFSRHTDAHAAGEPLAVNRSPGSDHAPDPRAGSLREAGRSTEVNCTPDHVQPPGGTGYVALAGEISALKSVVADLVTQTRRARDPSLPDSLHELYQQLIASRVAEETAAELVRRVRTELPGDAVDDAVAVRAKLASFVESMLPIAGPVRLVSTTEPTVVAFVGPTGTGKTTTVAKLAANYRLRHGRKVGLITTDTFRIGAVDQLQTYARIIDVPLRVVVTADDMRDALRAMRDRDVILIDTAGHSQNDASKLAELKELIDVAGPHEVHLALSSTSTAAVLNETIERFSALGVNRVVFTKLDEAVGFGVILCCLKDAEARLSYVTTGQNVPGDIQVGRRERLARLIVGGGSLSRSAAVDTPARPAGPAAAGTQAT